MKGVDPRLVGQRSDLPYWFVSAVVVLALGKLWLVSSQTLFAIGPGSHDDRLFLSLADSIAQGKWLGPYDELTLAKGPFYPIWNAFSYLLRIPLLLSQHLLYLGACVIATLAVKPLVRGSPWLLGIFALLLLNPMSFDSHIATRVIRAGIYPALTLLSVATAIGLLLRRHLPIARLLPWALACGFSVAAFWLTREEGVWLLPLLVPILGWTAFRMGHTANRTRAKVALCTLPLLIPVGTVHLVSIANKILYDSYAAVDINTDEFKAAYGALSRIKHAQWTARIPVPRETRLRIYAQSPAFAELRPSFERKDFWTLRAFGTIGHTAALEEISGAAFMWALRDAASQAGYYRSGATSSAYFRRLAREINTACEAQRLDCLPERASLMPPWRDEYVEPVLQAFSRGLDMLVNFQPFQVTPIPSKGSTESLELFRRMTRERLSPREAAETGKPIFVRVLATHASRPLTVNLIGAEGQLLASAKAKPSPEIESYFTRMQLPVPPHAGQARFELLAVYEKGCRLQVEAEGQVLARTPLRKGYTAWFSHPLWIVIPDVHRADSSALLTPLDRVNLNILAHIGRAYQIGLPILIVVALLAYGFHTWQLVRSRTISDIWVISSLLVTAMFGRLVILSLIDAMAFPAINPTYLAPAYPLLILAVTLMLIAPFVANRPQQPTTGKG